MYVESGGRNPVLETPLSAAASIMELLLQSWGGKIRVFPAVPEDWNDASFDQLRAQGGFLVSASRTQPVVKAISHSSGELNLYGVKKGKQLPKNQDWPLPEYKF